MIKTIMFNYRVNKKPFTRIYRKYKQKTINSIRRFVNKLEAQELKKLEK